MIALKKYIIPVSLLLIILFWLVRWQPDRHDVHTTTQLAMGTLVSLSVWGTKPENEEKVFAAVFEKIRQLEAVASRQDVNSIVYRINHAPSGEKFTIPSELTHIVAKGLQVHLLSGGAFDPGLAHISDLWGFTQGVPEVEKIPEKRLIDAWLEKRKQCFDYGIHLKLPDNDSDGPGLLWLADDSFALDLGAIAKGYILDQAMAVLKREGIINALIVGGGDMIIAGAKGDQPWRIGIQHPRDRDKVMASVEVLQDMALATSGDYERFFMADGQRQHHILDPKTGHPARSGLISVSIQAREAMIADALSTAVFVLGMEKGKALIERLEGVEGMLVQENGERWKSSRFPGQWLEE
ncbi:MAG: FAD:protein FMN transferase [Magnetococcales bacterium]|nr:FAD:protein FMN transferase [Magnetococcales bacterium]